MTDNKLTPQIKQEVRLRGKGCCEYRPINDVLFSLFPRISHQFPDQSHNSSYRN